MSDISPRKIPGAVLAGVGVLASVVCIAVILSSANPYIAAAEYVPWLLLLIGVLLIVGSIRAKDAPGFSAPNARTTTPESLKSSRTDHTSPGAGPARRTKRLTFHPLPLMLGIGLLAALLASTHNTPTFFYRQVPTAALIDEVKGRPADSADSFRALWDAWDVLEEQGLSNEQIIGLAEHFINAAPTEDNEVGAADFSASFFVRRFIRTGRVPEKVVDEFYGAHLPLKLSIVAPDTTSLGEKTELDVTAELSAPLWLPETELWALVRGFHVGGSAEPIATVDEVIEVTRLDKCHWVRDASLAKDDCAKSTIVGEHTGPLTVRFVVWLVVSDEWLEKQPINWKDDGSPQLPDSVVWGKRFEATHTIQVVGEAN